MEISLEIPGNSQACFGEEISNIVFLPFIVSLFVQGKNVPIIHFHPFLFLFQTCPGLQESLPFSILNQINFSETPQRFANPGTSHGGASIPSAGWQAPHRENITLEHLAEEGCLFLR